MNRVPLPAPGSSPGLPDPTGLFQIVAWANHIPRPAEIVIRLTGRSDRVAVPVAIPVELELLTVGPEDGSDLEPGEVAVQVFCVMPQPGL